MRKEYKELCEDVLDEEKVIDNYMDFRPVLDEYDKEFLKQIKEGTAFG